MIGMLSEATARTNACHPLRTLKMCIVTLTQEPAHNQTKKKPTSRMSNRSQPCMPPAAVYGSGQAQMDPPPQHPTTVQCQTAFCGRCDRSSPAYGVTVGVSKGDIVSCLGRWHRRNNLRGGCRRSGGQCKSAPQAPANQGCRRNGFAL